MGATGYDQGGAQRSLGHQRRANESWARSCSGWVRAMTHRSAGRFQQTQGPREAGCRERVLLEAVVRRSAAAKVVGLMHQKMNDILRRWVRRQVDPCLRPVSREWQERSVRRQRFDLACGQVWHHRTQTDGQTCQGVWGAETSDFRTAAEQCLIANALITL